MALAKEASRERLRKPEAAGGEEINPLNVLLRLSGRLGECFSPSAPTCSAASGVRKPQLPKAISGTSLFTRVMNLPCQRWSWMVMGKELLSVLEIWEDTYPEGLFHDQAE